jgi:hypothetical protein
MSRTWRDGTPSKVAVRAIPDAGSPMRVYFDVRGPGVLVDTYALQHAAPPDITLGEPGSVSFPVMNTGEGSDSFNFTATGLPAGWTASTDTKTLGAGAGGTATVTVTPPITAAAGRYTLTASGTSASDSTIASNSTFVVNLVRRATTIVYTGDLTADYHDVATVSATLTDTLSGLPLAAQKVSFALGTQTASATTDANGAGSSTITINQSPGAIAVDASFAGDGTYLASVAPLRTFTITKEETSITYATATVCGTRFRTDPGYAPNPGHQGTGTIVATFCP